MIDPEAEFALLDGNHAAVCLTCGKRAEVLVIEERRDDGSWHGPVYCFVHFVIEAARATGIA